MKSNKVNKSLVASVTDKPFLPGHEDNNILPKESEGGGVV
jgi:hypothetical protein